MAQLVELKGGGSCDLQTLAWTQAQGVSSSNPSTGSCILIVCGVVSSWGVGPQLPSSLGSSALKSEERTHNTVPLSRWQSMLIRAYVLFFLFNVFILLLLELLFIQLFFIPLLFIYFIINQMISFISSYCYLSVSDGIKWTKAKNVLQPILTEEYEFYYLLSLNTNYCMLYNT